FYGIISALAEGAAALLRDGLLLVSLLPMPFLCGRPASRDHHLSPALKPADCSPVDPLDMEPGDRPEHSQCSQTRLGRSRTRISAENHPPPPHAAITPPPAPPGRGELACRPGVAL